MTLLNFYNKIVYWIMDRIDAGMNEENGSMDWNEFAYMDESHKLFISKDTNEDNDPIFDVYLENDILPFATFSKDDDFQTIRKKVANDSNII